MPVSEEVQRLEKSYESMIQEMAEGVVVVDKEGMLIFVNLAAARLLGYEPEELVGQHWTAAVPPDQQPTVRAANERREKGQIDRYQLELINREQVRLPVQVSGSPRFDPETGRFVGSLAILTDIGEQVRGQQRLRLLDQVLAASVDGGQDIHAFLKTICRELAQTFGAPRSIATLLDEERATARVVAEYRAEGQPAVSGQTIAVAGSRAYQRLLDSKAPLFVAGTQAPPPTELGQGSMLQRDTGPVLFLPLLGEGQVIGSLELFVAESRPFSAAEVDLAKRVAEQVSGVLAHARLVQVQRQLSTAVERAAGSIVITDAQGNIQYINPAFERISGYGSGEAIGQNILSLRSSKLEPALREPSHKPIQQSIVTNQVWQGRIVSKRRDGTVYTEDATITPVRNPSGEIVSYVATMHDVTREMQLEEQFHQAQKMEAVGRLAGGIAHDFNNLLTVINLSTRLLEHTMQPGDPGREHLQRVQETGERATQLVKQLLTFSRRETLQSQKLNLNQVVEDLSLMLQRIIGEDIKLKIDLADDLWSATADPSQMEQVIMNLAVNARDAMPRGGTLIIKTANVILDAAYAALHVNVRPGDYIVLTISDTGVGMNHEVKSHLFEPFFTTKERGKGTGLGLATVFGIAKQSRGHIQVYSEVGYGTTIRFYLPRTDDLSTVIPSVQNEEITRSKGTDSRSPVLHPLPIGV